MKTYQKVLAAVAAVGLSTAAAFPYVKAYFDSQPKKLSTEQAGKAFLGAVCPINKNGNYLVSLDKKYKKESNTYYYAGSDALTAANQRVAQLELRMKLANESFAKSQISASKKLNNPKFIWPESVAKEIKLYSTHLFTEGGLLLQENFKESNKLNDKNLPSKIRQELNLPTIGKGCD